MVEYKLPKLGVAGSKPVARSNLQQLQIFHLQLDRAYAIYGLSLLKKWVPPAFFIDCKKMIKTLIETLRELIEPILLTEGMELIDIDYRQESRGWVLRFYIDKEGGLTLNHCSRVSTQIGYLLEVKDLIPHRYTLEVSSPGLNRPLKREKDFKTYVGEMVQVKTSQPIDQRRNFTGKLLGYKEGEIMIGSDNQEFLIPISCISKANLQYQFPDPKNKKKKAH